MKHISPDCTTANVQLISQNRQGLRVCHVYQYEKCSWNAEIWSTMEDENNLDINEAAVVGAINIEIGYSQLEKLFAAIGVKCMSNDRYQSCRNKAYTILKNTLEKNMKEAGEEEYRLAVESGNIKDDLGLITVLDDASWMKRAYQGNYNSPSGLVYIIGQRTGKII